jgi:hypothetical protein
MIHDTSYQRTHPRCIHFALYTLHFTRIRIPYSAFCLPDSFPCFCVSASLGLCVSVCLCLCVSLRVYISTCLLDCMSAYLYFCFYFCLFVSICVYLCVYFCLFCVHFCLFVSIFVSILCLFLSIFADCLVSRVLCAAPPCTAYHNNRHNYND